MNPFKLVVLTLQDNLGLPLPRSLALWAGRSPERSARALRYLPLAGAMLAVLMALAYAPCALWLPQSLSVVLALGCGLWVTGARHEAGWARFCESLTPIGAAGTLGLIMLMGLKIEALAALDPTWVGVSLLGAQVWSRVCSLWVMRSLPAAQASALMVQPRWRECVLALLVGLALLTVAVWLAGSLRPFAVGGLASVVASILLRRYMKRRLGGHNADGLSAVQQWAETAFYVGIVAALGVENVEVTLDPTS